ncbi:predicted protein [Nematostella vectensis]|uniref:Uncharacterized protein n=1 Tax=Nematostella vectensis TaxID=45351 RepID=A7T0X4_NEMVE|nr:predicted protein [Nematostella vectensis]|eukprot:XP_001622491.1 predicted protein [Nematostella vectensis]
MGILVDVYIDDFYGAAMPDVSQDEFNRMNSVFDELGLVASAAKDVLPCYCMTCLGVEIDTLDMTLTVPQFRVTELQGELNEWLTRTLYSKRDLQRLLGKLSFITSCIRPGRVYMCRLLNALRAISSRHSKLHVDDELRADIHWWLYLLRHYNGVSVIPSNITVANPELFASDACLTGCGAIVLSNSSITLMRCSASLFKSPRNATCEVNFKRIYIFVLIIRLNPSNFSSRSFRKGGATFAFNRGAPTEYIKAQGDWKSDAYLVYLTLSSRKKLAILNSITTRLANKQ